MGFSFRKSIKLGPARINVSKSGVGFSIGAGGLRYTKSPKRKTTSKSNKNTSQKKSIQQKRSVSTDTGSHTTAKPLVRSKTKAIVYPIIAFVLVGGIAFVAAFLLYALISIFVPDFGATVGSKILLIGLPMLLALIVALILFLVYRPLQENEKDLDEADS